MRWVFTPWVPLFVVASGGALATYMRCPGCIDRDRVNNTCEWTGDSAFPIDPQNASHEKHLVEDAQLAEELAIRNADAEAGRRTGVDHHGGLIDNGRFRDECLSRTFAAIESHHDVTAEDVRVARAQRDPAFDLAVALLFIPLYSVAATMVCRWIFGRFASDERRARLIAAGLASIAVSVFGVQSLRMWIGIWEGVVRLGNGHLTSIRAASYTLWNKQYPSVPFVGAMLMFWLIVVLFCFRAVSDVDCAAAFRGPRGILLR